jgi:hypothetical protein
MITKLHEEAFTEKFLKNDLQEGSESPLIAFGVGG